MKENNKNSTHNLDELKESVWTKCVTNEDISILEKCFKETCKCNSDDYGSCTYDYSSASSCSDDCCKDNTTYKPFQTYSYIVSCYNKNFFTKNQIFIFSQGQRCLMLIF